MSYIEREPLLEILNGLYDHHLTMHNYAADGATQDCINAVIEAPTADVVEVRADYNVGDFCLYGFVDGNKSLAIVEIVKILDDERGVAEVKFHKVIKDNTGNGFFHYLFKSGGTMNASFKYLKNITPKTDGERRENAD